MESNCFHSKNSYISKFKFVNLFNSTKILLFLNFFSKFKISKHKISKSVELLNYISCKKADIFSIGSVDIFQD